MFIHNPALFIAIKSSEINITFYYLTSYKLPDHVKNGDVEFESQFQRLAIVLVDESN